MKIILLLLLAALIAFVVITRNEELPAECTSSKILIPFFRTGMWITGKISASERFKNLLIQKNSEKIYLLRPGKDVTREGYIHCVKKCGFLLLALIVGMVMVLILSVKGTGETYLQEGDILNRREFGEGDYEAKLCVTVGDETFQNEEIRVLKRDYSDAEIQEMMPEFKEKLELAFLGNNESLSRINEDLNPIGEIKGYPFKVEWSFDRNVIDFKGHLNEGIPQKGVITSAEATITYLDHIELYEFPLKVYPKNYSHRDEMHMKMLSALEKADEGSSTQKEYRLPNTADGIEVVWKEEKKDATAVFFIIAIAVSAVIFWAPDNDLNRKVKARDEQLLSDYPEVVNKIALYVGAGMTIRNAWKKMTDEYQSVRKAGADMRYVYEEMLLAVYEMESGSGELAAYRNFAKRCRLQKYIKLVSLLEQNIKLGAKGFLDAIRHEAMDALEEQKATARKKGEEAGTKLLVPMILMLLIVMVVIIVPAFVTL
ncbi:MAG: hypothetical protein K6C99_08180 [Lachnospiraceae bacterium]|nr:hypothetical protein [Lachnospiraceae bacterium]